MRWVKFVFGLLLTSILAAVLMFPTDSIPFAVGKFLDPFAGFWQNAQAHTRDISQVEGLQKDADVIYDDRGVPHIFANNDHDLYFLQGYVTAQDRLWQMEFQVMAAGGRLTELVGYGPDSVVLDLDRTNRRKGMVFGAERALETMQKDPTTIAALQAYTDGINAYIQSLEPHELPIEYKVLGYAPEPWTPLKSSLLQKYMANTLTGGTSDIENTFNIAIWGKETFDLLFPLYPVVQSPIVPAETRFRRRDFLPRPNAPLDYHPDSLLLKGGAAAETDPDEGILGSNNWAVGGQKSETGYPILANDPHLGLNLPSIWYEIQMNAPGINVYGVSLPGAPSVIIGFNDSIAWGATNGTQDVLDFYAITYRTDDEEEYKYDGEWLPVRNVIETHKIKGGEVFLDTVHYTHIGPVMYDKNFKDKGIPLAVRWMAHEPSNELLAFHKLNRAHNYEAYIAAFETYMCPAQNFIFASTQGDIAIWQHGQFVNKWEGQGRYILDGSRKDHMWGDYIPREQIPHVHNPAQGFVQSANQQPTSRFYPYYYNGRFEDYRGRRIFDLLSSKDTMGLEDMRAFQMDNYSVSASEILPSLLSWLDSSSLTGQDLEVYQALKAWDYNYDPDDVSPTFYDRWWSLIMREIWRDEYEPFIDKELPVRTPKTEPTIRILKDSVTFTFYRKLGDTTEVTREAIANKTFSRMVTEIYEAYPERKDQIWGQTKTTDIRHLTRTLSPFSKLGISTGGNRHILNATGRFTGPSWRMVVMTGPEMKGYGVYPGGQSGHPGEKGYDNFIEDWNACNYYELRFMRNSNEALKEGEFKSSFTTKQAQSDN